MTGGRNFDFLKKRRGKNVSWISLSTPSNSHPVFLSRVEKRFILIGFHVPPWRKFPEDLSVVFSTMSIKLISSGANLSQCFYKNITISNLLIQLLFSMVDIIINQYTSCQNNLVLLFPAPSSWGCNLRNTNLTINSDVNGTVLHIPIRFSINTVFLVQHLGLLENFLRILTLVGSQFFSSLLCGDQRFHIVSYFCWFDVCCKRNKFPQVRACKGTLGFIWASIIIFQLTTLFKRLFELSVIHDTMIASLALQYTISLVGPLPYLTRYGSRFLCWGFDIVDNLSGASFLDWFQATMYTRVLLNVTKLMKKPQILWITFLDQYLDFLLSRYTQHTFRKAMGPFKNTNLYGETCTTVLSVFLVWFQPKTIFISL